MLQNNMMYSEEKQIPGGKAKCKLMNIKKKYKSKNDII